MAVIVALFLPIHSKYPLYSSISDMSAACEYVHSRFNVAFMESNSVKEYAMILVCPELSKRYL
jgi:hypothetical protein